MSRKKQKKTKHRQRVETPEENLNHVVQDTAAIFTCAFETAGDFASQCVRRREDLEADLLFARIALEIWQGRDQRTQELVAVLTAIVAETERQIDALLELERRLDPVITDETLHIHLDPPEAYRDLIRARIIADDIKRSEAEKSISQAIPNLGPEWR